MQEGLPEEVVLTPIVSEERFSDYLVDTIIGRVWSKKTNKWLSSNANDNGYVYCALYDDDGKRHGYGVHRVVMSSFTGIPLEMFKRGSIEIDHIEEDLKHVNGIHNLQMSDRKGHYRESTRMKMRKSKPRLSESEVCEILEQLEEWKIDEENKISDFIRMMAEAYNKKYRAMWNIVYRKTWTHLHSKVTA